MGIQEDHGDPVGGCLQQLLISLLRWIGRILLVWAFARIKQLAKSGYIYPVVGAGIFLILLANALDGDAGMWVATIFIGIPLTVGGAFLTKWHREKGYHLRGKDNQDDQAEPPDDMRM